MIEVKEAVKKYKGVTALNGVSLSVKKGEILLILGQNGAGKTTLIKSILGLLSINEGEINISDQIKVGYMQEEKFGKADWTVNRLLKYIGNINGIFGNNLEKEIDLMLEKFSIKKAKKMMIKELSKGMRQRVKYAQAALINPDLFILDEPTSGLDPIGKVEMRDWIIEERKKGKTFIISTHMLDEMSKLGERFIIIIDGEVKDSGEVKNIEEEDLEKHFYNVVKKG